MERVTALEVANKFSDFVNGFDHKGQTQEFIKAISNEKFTTPEAEFNNALGRQHRTLQQSMFRVMLGVIEHMASNDFHTDGRNEGSKKVAKQLIAGFKLQIAQEFRDQGVSEERIAEYMKADFGPSAYLGYI